MIHQHEILEAAKEAGLYMTSPERIAAVERLVAIIERIVERKTIERIKKQLLEEICFKMASGSPNRQRIHDLMKTWSDE